MMSTYASKDDLIKRFGNDSILDLADRNNDGVIDNDFINTILSDADSVINSYLASGDYQAVGTNVPDLIKSLACDIAFYRLHPSGATEESSNRYKEAMRMLERIGDGKQKIDLPKNITTVKGGDTGENAIVATTGRQDWKNQR